VFTVLVAVMVGMATICLVIATRAIDKPFAGFLYYPFRNVGSVGDLEWAGLKAGARYQDIVEEVNGKKVSTSAELHQIVVNTRVGTPIRYLLNRHADTFVIEVPVSVFTTANFLKLFGPLFVAGILFFLIGIIVYVLKPDTAATWAFLLFCLSLGIYIVTGLPTQLPPHSVLLYAIGLLALPVFPAALLHLSLLFPERTALVARRSWIQYVPYALAVGIDGYHVVSLVTIASATLGPAAFVSAHTHLLRGINVSRLYAILAATSIVVSSSYVYFRSRSVIAKQRARVILSGSAVAFLPPTLVMPLVLVAKLGVPFNVIVLPALAFPVAVGYAIARHNLFDVDVYIKRALGYGVMTAVVGIGYLSAQTFVRTVILDPVFGSQAQHVYPILFAVLIVFFFNPVNRRIQDSVDRIFFRKKLDYKETISWVSNALTSMLNLDQIVRQVVHTIRREMFIDTAGVIVLDPKTRACRSFFVGDEPKARQDVLEEIPVGYDDPLLALLRAEKTLITKYDLEEDARYLDVKAPCLQQLAAMAASMAIPLMYRGEVTGLLALGEKKSGQFYGREDVDLLSTMANQAAVAIQNATAHEEVVRYAEELAASLRRIQVLESIKTNLAKFVPKTVQELIEESPEAPSFDKREVDVSVVFADITGYTRLSAQMELDQVNRLVERYFGAFLDEIVKYGGDVNETVGDGLMVIFRDSDPQRHARAAVLAALGIQRRTAEINTGLQGQSDPIEMHVGVNSGIASVGATKIEGAAGTRWTYTASGPTTNVAARLAALGEGDAVILSEETRRRLGAEVRADDLGPQSLKNVAQPVRVYRITARDGEEAAAHAFLERRRYPRQPVSWPVRLWIGEESFEGRGTNASVYGICVASIPMALLEPGRSYTLEIGVGGDKATKFVATVRNLGDRGVGLETKDALPIR
jgi:class 3 adenylate cyclase